MKKLIAVFMLLVMVVGLCAACSGKDTPAPTEPPKEVSYTPISILAGAVAQYKKDDVVFNASLDMVVDMKENRDFLQTILYVPQDQMANITGAATMMHMNQNSFTGAALEMKDGTDIAAFTKTMRDTIMTTQWFCGFPEKLLIATVGDKHVVIAYGLDNEEAPLISTFQKHLLDAHGEDAVKISYQEKF